MRSRSYLSLKAFLGKACLGKLMEITTPPDLTWVQAGILNVFLQTLRNDTWFHLRPCPGTSDSCHLLSLLWQGSSGITKGVGVAMPDNAQLDCASHLPTPC